MSYSVPHLLLPLLEKFTLIDALLQILVNDVENVLQLAAKLLKFVLHLNYVFCTQYISFV